MKRWIMLLGFLSIASAHAEILTVQGYGEGDYLRIGSPLGGTVAVVAVREGDWIEAGQPLFSLDDRVGTASRDQAMADLQAAQAGLADLVKGKRPDELASIAQRKAQAEAQLRLSEATLTRQMELAKQDYASRAKLDEAQAAAQRDRALVREIGAEYRTATLGARSDLLAQAQALIAQRQARLVEAEKHLSDLAPVAPQAGRIERIYYRPGEVVAAGRPVVSLLPPENIKLVFFVPQSWLSRLSAGKTINWGCDGCKGGQATVSYVGSEAEYTPPVIYSVESRQKLVYRIEARGQTGVHPGQPVDIRVEASE